MTNIALAQELFQLFKKHGQDLYLVGGSVRDYLLTGDFQDFDFASPAKKEVILKILNTDDYDPFSFKYGSIKTHYRGKEIVITTFRLESAYKDYRHPSSLTFTTSIQEDAERRDFTINALYLDAEEKIHDFYQGQEDLRKGIIRCIGSADQRIKEDPVRILRALRFALKFDFKLDKVLETAIKNNKHLLQKISPYRLKIEMDKLKESASLESIREMLDCYELSLEI